MESVAVTGSPVGEVAVATAEFATCPASTSASASTYVAVQVVLCPGSSVVNGQLTVPTLGSRTLSR